MFLPAVAGPVDPGTDPALLSSVLTLSDVFCTSHHCAVKAGVGPRTSVTVLGAGTHTVLECVGTRQALETAFGVVRDGGVVSRVGVPQYTEGPIGFDMVMRNLTLTGGTAPARAYIEQLLPDVLVGTIQPGRLFDRTVGLDEVPDGYRAMAAREALKVLVRP